MTWPLQRDIRAFYGDPDADRNGEADRKWEDANLTRILPAYPMLIAWDLKAPVKAIRCHRLVAPSLERILRRIGETFPDRKLREKAGLHLFGGCYNFRAVRGGSTLSTHAFAAAIDINPAGNPLGVRWRGNAGMMPREVVAIFEAEGWVWGGHWSRPDCQHFQAARV